jgi:hypothetical protein
VIPGKKNDARSLLEKALIFGPIILIIAAASICVLFYFSIFSGVKSICSEAKKEFNGDSVEALMTLIESDKFGFREKNKAIWALGQIGDRRALPLLEKLNTGEVQKAPYNPEKYIVQYTVKKAIKQCKGEFSLTRWTYRWLE